MTPVFIDTSFLLALVRKSDQHHQRAVSWKQRVRGPLLTTEYVLIEFADCCAVPALRDACARAIDLMRADPLIQLVPASTRLLDEGLSFFRERRDKSWGITDCISFRVTAANAISEALSSDRDFEQAGFVALLRRDPTESET